VSGREELRFRRGDAVATGAVILAALCCIASMVFAPRPERTVARVYLKGELIRTAELGKDDTFTVEGEYRNTVVVRDGSIAVTESDCPGADCVHSGRIRTPGRSIVCLPNRMEVRLEGDGPELDAVVR